MTASRRTIIINADDFGYSASVNRAILRAFDERLISSTTVMANMPGFEEAAVLAQERQLLTHIGTHLVLTEGEPLTDPIRRCRRFCDAAGRFIDWRGQASAYRLSREEGAAIAEELRAQVECCRSHGFLITHLDSHKSVHHQSGILNVVVAVAREFGISAVRVMEPCSRSGASVKRRAYLFLVGARLRLAGLAATRYFCDISHYLRIQEQDPSAAMLRRDGLELMTHPVFDESGRLVDALNPVDPLAELVKGIAGYEHAVSFAQARGDR